MSNEAIPAATLILIQEAPGGSPRLLMVERAQNMAFAGGALVFPGGRIDQEDFELGGATEHAPAAIAAIRECLEETAVPASLRPLPDTQRALSLQARLAAGESFRTLLDAEGLSLDSDALTPFARWVPKFHAKRRFDTLFFVARAPEGGWTPRHLEGECTGAFWTTADDVLARDRAGEAKLIFPTRRILERLALHSSFEAIAADARAHSIEPVSPWLEEVGGEQFITIPEGLGYPVTREKLDGLWRG